MAGGTEVKGAEVNEAVRKLRGLISSKTLDDFQALTKFELNAGPPQIDAAQWLVDLTIDRRHALIAHVRSLKEVFDNLADTLTKVSNALRDKDADSATQLEGGVVEEINNWIIETRDFPFDPALGGGHFMTGKTSYETPDTGNPDGAFLSYDIDATGQHVKDGDGNLVMDLPEPDAKGALPSGKLFDDYKAIFDEAGENRPAINEDFIFADGKQVIRPGDPENEK